GKVFILHDQDRERVKAPTKPSILVCLDAVKGTVIWEKERPAERACYSSPFVVEKGGKKELILVTTPGIVAFDMTNGAELWKFDWKFDKISLRTVGSAMKPQDIIIAASGDRSGDRNYITVKIDRTGN